MKKFFVIALALVAYAAFALPASAFESEFGGYWRTRAYTEKDFAANGSEDLSQVDTRTRLFYTAKFSDNLKFVNKFEMNGVWGLKDGDNDASRSGNYGRIGADGLNFEVKNTYLDATFCDWNLKVGTHDAVVARGFLFDDDFSGVTLTYNGAGFDIPVIWVKAVEGGEGRYNNGKGKMVSRNDLDIDYLIVTPTFSVADQFTINPVFMLVYSKDAQRLGDLANVRDVLGLCDDVDLPGIVDDLRVYYFGINADMDFGMGNAWFTGIYQYGTLDVQGAKDIDIRSYLLAIGADVELDVFNVHAQTFYASGDDGGSNFEQFIVPAGQSYYWAEIMGLGIFDNNASNGSPADQIGNIWATNIGASMSPMEKLTVTADIWYAKLAEKTQTYKAWPDEDDYLGTELDLVVNYKIMDNLAIDLVGAYLFAGNATGKDNPWLLGTQLSLSF